MASAADANLDPLLSELMAIKRLMVFDLLRSGVTQEQVAKALGTGQSQVSKMFPGGLGVPGKRSK